MSDSRAVRFYSLAEVRELPSFSALVRNARRPELAGAYVSNDVGFTAIRASGVVVELWFGPRGGILRERVIGRTA